MAAKYDNYKKLGITGYAINFGIPAVQIQMIIFWFGGNISGVTPLLLLSAVLLLIAGCYIYGLICLISLIIDTTRGKQFESSALYNIGIFMYFVPIVMILLMNATYDFFK